MSTHSRPPLSRWLTRAAPGLLACGTGVPANAAAHLGTGPAATAHRLPAAAGHGFAYDGVLGTSLDAQLAVADPRDAAECERAVLQEIDRVARLLSPRDPDSELNRVRAGAAIESPELGAVLAAYAWWGARTHGALEINLDEVAARWREAARTGQEPDGDVLAAAFQRPRALQVDALGKAYIVDRAVEVARRFVPAGLINIGGDIRGWGDGSWSVAVAHPANPAENAPPLAEIPLRDAAIATSGGYARGLRIGAHLYSHIIDPRTLRPLPAGRAATAVAADCVSANALSLALCVLDDAAGTAVGRAHAQDFLRVDFADGASATGGFAAVSAVERAGPSDRAALAADAAALSWPDNFQVTIDLALKTPDGFRARRPYVAVWVEDQAHNPVRTIAVWGRGKYQPDLTKWWRAIRGDRSVIAAVSRATRAPGAYTLAWDGRDDRGQPVPRGTYTICVEINREHGHHIWQSATAICGTEASMADLPETAESDGGAVSYGPRRN